MTDSRLSIVLTLKGRHLHTLRWLWHANKISFPFHIIIADGEVHPEIFDILKKPGNFPNISYEYHQYNDASLSDYYNKVADALDKVKSPYVMMADNDDFLLVSGLMKCLNFLDVNQQYICAQGGIAGFVLKGKEINGCLSLVGKINETRARYSATYKSRDLDSQNVLDRVLDEIEHYHTIYYGVYRTPTLKIITKEIAKLNFSSTQIHERFWAVRAVTLGKVKSDPSLFTYFRQYGSTLRTNIENNWAHKLVKGDYTGDLNAMFDSLGAVLSDRIDGTRDEIIEKLRHAYGVHLDAWLYRRYGISNNRLKEYLSLIKREIKSILSLVRDRDYVLYRELKCNGAETNMINEVRNEIRTIERSLCDKNFLEFIRDFDVSLFEC